MRRKPRPKLQPGENDYAGVCTLVPGGKGPVCGQPATVHLLVAGPGATGWLALPSCAEHVDIGRRCDVLDEHVHQGMCGMPSTKWDTPSKSCVLNGLDSEPDRTGHKLVARDGELVSA